MDDWTLVLAYVLGGALLGGLIGVFLMAAVARAMKRMNAGDYVRALSGGRMLFAAIFAILGGRFALESANLSTEWIARANDALFVIGALLVTSVAARVGVLVFNVWLVRSGSKLPATSIFTNVIRWIVYIVGGLVILQYLGISITPLLTALGVGGLAVALALQDTLSSLFAGLHILAAGAIKPGDFIELETGQAGEVIDITWRDTIIRTQPNNEVIIPNSKMTSSIVTNYQLPASELSVLVSCGVSYDSDLEQVEKVALDVARSTVADLGGAFGDWEPSLRFHTFGDSGIEFTIVLRAQEFVDQHPLRSEFIKRLKKRFDQEGIKIPFPQRVVHLPATGPLEQ